MRPMRAGWMEGRVLDAIKHFYTGSGKVLWWPVLCFPAVLYVTSLKTIVVQN